MRFFDLPVKACLRGLKQGIAEVDFRYRRSRGPKPQHSGTPFPLCPQPRAARAGQNRSIAEHHFRYAPNPAPRAALLRAIAELCFRYRCSRGAKPQHSGTPFPLCLKPRAARSAFASDSGTLFPLCSQPRAARSAFASDSGTLFPLCSQPRAARSAFASDSGTLFPLVLQCGLHARPGWRVLFVTVALSHFGLGLHATSSAVGGGYTSPTVMKKSLGWLVAKYPNIRGAMTWSINWDDGYASYCQSLLNTYAIILTSIFCE